MADITSLPGQAVSTTGTDAQAITIAANSVAVFDQAPVEAAILVTTPLATIVNSTQVVTQIMRTGAPGPRGDAGVPGPPGPAGADLDGFDPGDLTLLFDNKLI